MKCNQKFSEENGNILCLLNLEETRNTCFLFSEENGTLLSFPEENTIFPNITTISYTIWCLYSPTSTW